MEFQPPAPFGAAMHTAFALAPHFAHLNHGAFGAPPRAVLQVQAALRARMEAEPSKFFERDFLEPEMRAAAGALADYLSTDVDGLALIENATIGVNAVLRHLDFAPGDEILITDQTYGAVANAAAYVAARAGAVVRRVALPFPAAEPSTILSAFEEGLTPRTRLAIIDHVTSQTAQVLPVTELVAAARVAGALTLVDGAHAPGMLEFDLATIGADWYTGNCHKWLFTPRSCAFLWAAHDQRAATLPLVVSHGYGLGFPYEFDWVGTRDVTAQLALPAALRLRAQWGETTIQEHNRRLILAGSTHVAEAWGTEVGTPPALTGAMRCVALPAGFAVDAETAHALRWQLAEEDRVQVPILPFAGRLWARLSAQVYNTMDDYARLAAAVARRRTNRSQ